MKAKVKTWVLAHQVISVLIFAALLIALLAIAIANQASAPNSSDTPGITTGNTPITATGEIVCLPHKNTEGPQTLECAYGMKTDGGIYYALVDPTSDYSFIGSVGGGQHVKVTGILKTSVNSKYQDVGRLEITSLEKL